LSKFIFITFSVSFAMSIKKKILFFVIGITFLSSLYCFGRHVEDQRWLDREARRIVASAGATDRRGQILAIRDYLRLHVRHEGAPHDHRPFLRASAREILESGQGYCGEASRACVNLLCQLGIPARRINLYGRINHVIVEVSLADGSEILVDPQDNPETNRYFDRKDRHLDSIIGDREYPFSAYSTIHLRRIPIVGTFIQRVRLRNSPITWAMENPWLIKTLFASLISLSMLNLVVLDRLLMKFYAARLGVRLVHARPGGDPGTEPSKEGSAPCTLQFPAPRMGQQSVEALGFER